MYITHEQLNKMLNVKSLSPEGFESYKKFFHIPRYDVAMQVSIRLLSVTKFEAAWDNEHTHVVHVNVKK